MLSDQIKDSIISLRKNRAIIAIDGYDASGKTMFAQRLHNEFLTAGLESYVISIDGFHWPKKIRYENGNDSATGFYRNSYDYELFIAGAINPFLNGSDLILAKGFDLLTDRTEHIYMKIPQKCILIVEGIFMQRRELRDFWDVSIYLKITEEESLERNLRREYGDAIPHGKRALFQKRYIEGQRMYHAEIMPMKLADFIVDNSEFDNPKIIRKIPRPERGEM